MRNRLFVLVFGVFVIIVVGLLLSSCGQAVQTEQDQTNALMEKYVQSQPIPVGEFEWSLERHLMIELYVARNNAVSTFSVVWDSYRGKIRWSCPSIGYPIPGGTELTNPQQALSTTGAVIAQAEPNGLYAPGTSYGTFVMCVNDDGTVSPVFIEDSILTFPYPMIEVDGMLMQSPDTVSSIKINTEKPKNK